MSDHVESSLALMADELKEVVDWQGLGLQLRLTYSELKIIEVENRGNVRKSLRKMLDVWLESNPNSSWEQIVEALEKINKKTLAVRLKKYVKSTTQHTSTTENVSQESFNTTTSEQKVVMKLSRFTPFSCSFDDVQREFRSIEVNIQAALENVCIIDVVRTCRKLDSKQLPFYEGMRVDDLFDYIRPHYSYLNFILLEEIARVYLDQPINQPCRVLLALMAPKETEESKAFQVLMAQWETLETLE